MRLKEQQAFRAQNPLLDLFGTWKVASRLFVSHLMPEVNVQPDTVSHIRRDLDTNAAMMAQLDEGEQDRFYERQDNQGMASKTEALIKIATRELAVARKAKDAAKLEQLNAKLEELKERKKASKGDDASDNTKHLLELQTIPCGIDLSGKLTVMDAKANDLRVLVQALAGFADQPYLGAQRARGCGEIRLRAAFKNGEGDVLAVVSFGDQAGANIEWTAAGEQFLASASPALAA